MKSLKLISRISPDGILRLEIPAGMPNQELEVTVVLKPSKNIRIPREWPPDFFEKTAGLFQNGPLERGDQGEYEIRESLK